MLVIKGSSGLMGLSADKRITNCTNLFGDGIMLLLQTMVTAVMFFFDSYSDCEFYNKSRIFISAGIRIVRENGEEYVV